MGKDRQRQCSGVVTSNDRRERPLVRCKELAEPDDDYCDAHAQERERQDRLRAVLKRGWERTVIAGRGRESAPSHLPKPKAAKAAPKKPEPKPEAQPTGADLLDPEKRKRWFAMMGKSE